MSVLRGLRCHFLLRCIRLERFLDLRLSDDDDDDDDD